MAQTGGGGVRSLEGGRPITEPERLQVEEFLASTPRGVDVHAASERGFRAPQISTQLVPLPASIVELMAADRRASVEGPSGGAAEVLARPRRSEVLDRVSTANPPSGV